MACACEVAFATVHPVFSVDPGLRANRHGHIEIVAHVQPEETGRRNSHYLHRMSIQRGLFTDRLRISAKLALPKSMADYCARRPAAGTIVFRRKHSAYLRLYSQRLEIVTAHPQTPRHAHISARGQIEILIAPGEDTREGLLMTANLLPLRVG
jgi:hypothetical protein